MSMIMHSTVLSSTKDTIPNAAHYDSPQYTILSYHGQVQQTVLYYNIQYY